MRCRLCGTQLEGLQRVWCSKRCTNRWRKIIPSKPLECLACSRTVLVPPSDRYRRSYCSKRCADSHYNSNFLTGPNNPRWRGGRILSYGGDWKRIKREVRDRDQVCRQCGKTPQENGRALDVHHIEPYRFSGDHSLENLVALCRSCHMRSVDRGRRGAAKFAGPKQLELRPPSHRELQRRRGERQKARRRLLQDQAWALRASGQSLRQIGRVLGVSHQTVADWLAAEPQTRSA